MPDTMETNDRNSGIHTATNYKSDIEALVIGAGFSGLRMLLELRERGVPAQILEAGVGIGGAWYWNNYPGCRTDVESSVYCMDFSEELYQEWTWKEQYATQPEVREYLNYVADRFDLRRSISFNSKVTAAYFDNEQNIWHVRTSRGDSLSCRFLVFGTGFVSAAKKIPFPGFDTFQGEWYQTSSWPEEKQSLQGKRVAVIGTGSSGVQVTPLVSHAAKSVHVFQRTPNYILRSRYETISQERATGLKADYSGIWARARENLMGFDQPSAGRTFSELNGDAVSIKRVLDAAYETGGFGFLLQVFDDVFTNKEANETMCEYLREKTFALVKDPETAARLNPDYPLFTKRPVIGHGYLESFNKPHVHLVDVHADPINAIVPTGIRTASGKQFDVDVIIYALGFDAHTGAITGIDLRGREGRTIQSAWSKSIDTYQGLTLEGFPNMFMLSGPKTVLANFPLLASTTAIEIGKMITFVRDHGHKAIEPLPEAQERWSGLCDMIFNGTVMAPHSARVNSWEVGANIPGKPTGSLWFLGGLPAYTAQVAEESIAGYPNYVLS
ncbi:hypothetical protein BJY01DRAFT_261453 [Aspergillus pseudoustus]|uniref:Cyclohexanone monooxygenase n=1 Tax=Aspergillus pseudoustus TaxID=1810923 RepID=A0ABR4IM43_9EURO